MEARVITRAMWNRVFLAALLPALMGAPCNVDPPPSGEPQDLSPCQQLVLRYCGDADAASTTAPCRGGPSCEAARLTAQHEMNNCPARLQGASGWEACVRGGIVPSDFGDGGGSGTPTTQQSCSDLVNKVCGLQDDDGGVKCGDAGPCVAAREVEGTANNATCVDALGDDTSFPRCALP
jgi:hypothetical protein